MAKSFLPAKTPKLIGQTEVRPILLWHAFEESEHKAVAFDVYRLVGGTERTRVRGMRIASVILFGELILQTALSMAADKASYNPVTLVRQSVPLQSHPMFTADALRRSVPTTARVSILMIGTAPRSWSVGAKNCSTKTVLQSYRSVGIAKVRKSGDAGCTVPASLLPNRV